MLAGPIEGQAKGTLQLRELAIFSCAAGKIGDDMRSPLRFPCSLSPFPCNSSSETKSDRCTSQLSSSAAMASEEGLTGSCSAAGLPSAGWERVPKAALLADCVRWALRWTERPAMPGTDRLRVCTVGICTDRVLVKRLRLLVSSSLSGSLLPALPPPHSVPRCCVMLDSVSPRLNCREDIFERARCKCIFMTDFTLTIMVRKSTRVMLDPRMIAKFISLFVTVSTSVCSGSRAGRMPPSVIKSCPSMFAICIRCAGSLWRTQSKYSWT
mmetsp:Transcript_133276/g.231174  ORF Transcript_133276/g.231174 Transcript_133276/m.231174 type:complete len:268 (+) Transcript_133276:621-1424(+)